MILLSFQMYSQVPKMISYQGVLTDSQNQLVPSGTYSMIFKLYDLKSGGSLLWQETQNVAVVNGLFNVILGSVVSVNLTFDRQYFLEIEATYNAVSYKFPERVQLTSVAYAFKAMTVEEKPYLKELKDVDITTPTAGQVLKFDGNKWKPDADNTSSGGNNGVSSLNSLQGDLTITQGNNINISKNTSAKTLTIDANITSISPNIISQGGAQNNQVLKWNGINWTPANDDITTNISLSNIQQSGANSGQMPKWNGSTWVPANDSISELIINGKKYDSITFEAGKGISLQVFNKKIVVNSSDLSPVASVTAFAGDTSSIPPNWMLCDGKKLKSTDYSELNNIIGVKEIYGKRELIGSDVYFYIPDYRGLFLRGVNYNRVDNWSDSSSANRTGIRTGSYTGNNVGSLQNDMFRIHNHGTPIPGTFYHMVLLFTYLDVTTKSDKRVPQDLNTSDTGGNETRPKNIYVNYIIKVK